MGVGRLLPCLPEHHRVNRGGLLLAGRSRLRCGLVVVLGEDVGPCVSLTRSEAMSQSRNYRSQVMEGDRDDRPGEGLVEVLVLVVAGLPGCHGGDRPWSC